MTPLQHLTAHLTPDERQELQDVSDYLAEHSSGRNRNPMPEGSVAKVINRCSPAVRDALSTLSETLDTPRTAPFQSKMSQAQVASTIGLDPRTTAAVKQRMEDEDIAAGLQRQMGTDAADAYGKPPRPPTDRELIETAIDLHGGTDTQDFRPGMANAAEGRSLRETLNIITEHTE